MDERLFCLLQAFSRDLTATQPPDLDTFGLTYMQRAYELGKVAGRAEVRADPTSTDYEWYSDGRKSGGESSPLDPNSSDC
jgi:hypothetical protein